MLFKRFFLHPYVILLFVGIVAYWQIVFFQYSVKWDMLNCWLPWRFFIGDCIQNGEWPMWNPYQQMGYPIHADMQGPVWYPESIIISLFSSQNIYTLQLLFFFYCFVGGVGMYRLSSDHTGDPVASLAVATAYMLSGFFVSHTQHFYSIISAAWIPYLLYYYLKLLDEDGYQNAVKSAFFLYLLLTGGNHTFTFMCIYFFAGLSVLKLIPLIRQKHKAGLQRFVKKHLLFAITAFLFALPVFISYFQVSPFISRLSGLSFEDASVNSFPPYSLISLLLPFTGVDAAFFNADISMLNLYAGIIVFLFFVFAFFLPESFGRRNKYYVLIAVFFLFLSFGSNTPLYKFAYDYLPFVDKFRFPSYFNFWTLICMLLISAHGLSMFLKNPKNLQRRVLGIAIAVMMFLVVLIFYALRKDGGFENLLKFIENGIDENLINKMPVTKAIIFQGLLQCILLSFFVTLLLNYERFKKLLLPLLVLEAVLAVQFNLPLTAVSNNEPLKIQKFLSASPVGFPIPSLEKKIVDNRDQYIQEAGLWTNTNVYSKNISFQGLNSFALKHHELLDDRFPKLRDQSLNNPLLFLSDRILPLSALPEQPEKEKDHDILYLENEEYNLLKTKMFKISESDSIQLARFSPGYIETFVHAGSLVMLTLLQSDYTGWKVCIDGAPVPYFRSNLLFISVPVPPGNHRVEFIYNNPYPLYGFYISLVALSAGGYFVLKKRYKERDLKRNKSVPFIPVLFITGAVIYFFVKTPSSEIEHSNSIHYFNTLQEYIKTCNVKNPNCIVNAEKGSDSFIPPEIKKQMKISRYYFTGESDYTTLADLTSRTETDTLFYVWSNAYNPPIIKEILKMYYPVILSEKSEGRSGYMILARNNSHPTGADVSFESVNGFEEPVKGWDVMPARIDSLVYLSGQKSCRLDTVNRFSPAFKVKMKNISEKARFGKMLITLKVNIKSRGEGILVFTTMRNEKAIHWFGSSIEKSVPKNAVWNSVIELHNLEDLALEPDDEIVVYVWNNGKGIYNLDDVRIKFIP